MWELITELPPIPLELTNFTADYYEVGLDEAWELVDPDDIVDSAAAWDDHDYVAWVSQFFVNPDGSDPIGYRTQDGAVVLDYTRVDLRYFFDDKE